MELAKRALRAIAGEGDIAPILTAIAGGKNQTTATIQAKYEAVRAMAARRAKQGREEEGARGATNAMTRGEREWAINALSYVGSGLSREGLQELGFKVGKDLFRSTQEFISAGDPIYTTPTSNYPGRKKCKLSTQIADRWVDMSQVLSRTNSAGENLRAVLAGKAKAASAIKSEFACAKSTAYKYCPETVVGTRKHTDLCCYCEALRKVRLTCIRLANVLGASLAVPGEFAGQSEVSDRAEQAEVHLKAVVGNEVVDAVLVELAIFTWHENAAKALTMKMKGDFGVKLVIVFDYSGSIPLKSVRGDADEFFRPKKVGLFGMMLAVPCSGGGRENFYFDVFSFHADHTSKTAAACLKCGLRSVLDSEVLSTLPGEISFYSDKGKHFCSGEMLYETLFEVAASARCVNHTFFAPNHGKTPLDSHFSKVKDAIDCIPVADWSHLTIKKAKNLLSDSLLGIKNAHCAFLSQEFFHTGPRKKLVIPNISRMQEFRRETDPYTLEHKLVVENTVVPIRAKSIVEGQNATEPDSEQDEHLGAARDSAVLCERLRLLKMRQSVYK